MIFDIRTDEQQLADTSSMSPVGAHSSRRRMRAKTTHSRPRIQELIMESRARRAAEADESEESLGRSEHRARTTHSGRAKLMEVMRMSQLRKQEQAAAASREDSEDDQRISIRPSHTVTSCEESIRMTVDDDDEEGMGQAPSLVNWRRGHGFCDEEDTEEPRMSLRYTSDRVSLNSVSSVSDDIMCLCRFASEEASTCATPRDMQPAMKYTSSPESSVDDASYADSESEGDVPAVTVMAPTCPKPASAYRRRLYSVKNSTDNKSTSSTPVAPPQARAAGGPTSPLTRRCIQSTQICPVPVAATQLADVESTQEWRSSLQAINKDAKVNKPLRPERPLISKATPRGRLTQLSSCTKQALTEIPGLVDLSSYRAVVAPPSVPKSREQTWRRRRLSLNLNQ